MFEPQVPQETENSSKERKASRRAEDRAQSRVEQFATSSEKSETTESVSTQDVGNPSPEWSYINNISLNRDVWDDNFNTAGIIEYNATLYENDSANLGSRSEFSVTERGFMNPAIDNNFGSAGYENERTVITQRWNNLEPTDHQDHQPQTDKTDEFDIEYTLGADTATVTFDYQVPYIKRDVQYEPNKRMQTEYTYPTRLFGDQARDSNCSMEQGGIWQVEQPSTDDIVTNLEFFGEFKHSSNIHSGTLLGSLQYK